MSSETKGLATADQIPIRIYTTCAGHTVIEQPNEAAVTLTAEQILTVITQLRACYDYCAAWKMSPTSPSNAEAQP